MTIPPTLLAASVGTAAQASNGDRTSDGSESVESTSPAESLSKDELFHILSVSRRRDVLRYLDENEGTATLGTIAEHIAAKENDVPEPQLSSTQRKRVYVALYQVHLPKMDDAGVLDYHQSQGSVELTDLATELFTHLYLDESGGPETDRDQNSGIAGWLRSLLT